MFLFPSRRKSSRKEIRKAIIESVSKTVTKFDSEGLSPKSERLIKSLAKKISVEVNKELRLRKKSAFIREIRRQRILS